MICVQILFLASGNCKHGVCSVDINKPDMTYAFQNLGIQCVRRKDAPASLDKRQKIKVDPFKQGFGHKAGPIDLNCVRLCFQVIPCIVGHYTCIQTDKPFLIM